MSRSKSPPRGLLPLLLLSGACALEPVRTLPAHREMDGVSFHVDARPESLLAVVHVTNGAADDVKVTAVRYTTSSAPGALSTMVPWGRTLAPGEVDSLRLDLDPKVPLNQIAVSVEWEKTLRTRMPRKRPTGPPSALVGGPPVEDPVPTPR